MKYRGFIIEPVYHIGSDFKIKNGAVIPRKPTSKDINYYAILDPMENNRQHCGADTIGEAKQEIDRICDNVDMMRNNTKKFWDNCGA